MRVVCDVHIPYRLVNFLRERGVDATHVNRILDKWYTADSDIARHVDEAGAFLITKDAAVDPCDLLSRSWRCAMVDLGRIRA
jgi:predicted nuclease of predicted toxin-antitoxin system